MAAWWGVEYPAGGIFPMENRGCGGGCGWMKVQGPWMSIGDAHKIQSTKGKTPISFLAEFVVVGCIFCLRAPWMDLFFLFLEFESLNPNYVCFFVEWTDQLFGRLLAPPLPLEPPKVLSSLFSEKGDQLLETFLVVSPPNKPWKETSAASWRFLVGPLYPFHWLRTVVDKWGFAYFG